MNKTLFEDSLERFSHMCPQAAVFLPEDSDLQFCKTIKGEVNLKRDGSYYHSQEGAVEEAEKWFNAVCPIGIKVIVYYGIGLGYIYDALKQWFQNDPGRLLLIIEDDLAVLNRFLETENAARILRDPQVFIQYFPTPGERDWGKFREQFSWVFWAFSEVPILYDALPLYKKERGVTYQLVVGQIKLNIEDTTFLKPTLYSDHAAIFDSFYHNLTLLDQSAFTSLLKDKFANVPAVISGGGPSLTKQLPLLKLLEDRALIFGSGSALNILNQAGIQPHFGVGIDPTATQESRFMTNTAYELPIFFALRFYHGACKKIHGPRLYTFSGVPFTIHNWFFEQLEIPFVKFLLGGISSSNACESIAEIIGSSPIILVGLDLAYTDSLRYAPGVTAHPVDSLEEKLAIGQIAPSTIPAVSVDGKEIKTKASWIREAAYFTQFSEAHPEISVINATEGGLKILEVPHLPLQEVLQSHCTRSYDLRNWIHAELMLSSLPTLAHDKIIAALEKWEKSLKTCLSYIEGLLDEWKKLQNSDHLTTPRMALLQTEMEAEPAYIHFLKEWSGWFTTFSIVEWRKLEFFPEIFSGKRRQQIICHLESSRCQFLKDFAEAHLRSVQDALKSSSREMAKAVPQNIPEDLSRFENGKLFISDEEISYEEEFEPTETIRSDGKEMFYKQSLRHGPSSFYGPEGQLLARGWFWNDKRVGKNWQYTLSGTLYSLLHYREGLLHARQEYYYPNGQLKTVMHYKEGLLHGEVQLFYSNGRLKRQLNFTEGRLSGLEQCFNETGLLTIEAHYQNGLPVGTSRMWHPNGRLAKEITFNDNPQNFSLSIWDESGRLIQKRHELPENPLTEMLQKSQELMEEIDRTTQVLQKAKERENLA